MPHEKLTRSKEGMLRYQYALSEDDEVAFDFHTLAEVGEPYQQWFRDEIKALGWTVEFGRSLDAKPYVADFTLLNKEVMTDAEYRDLARKQCCKDEHIAIDEDAPVRRGDDLDAFVQAWIWVEMPREKQS